MFYWEVEHAFKYEIFMFPLFKIVDKSQTKIFIKMIFFNALENL